MKLLVVDDDRYAREGILSCLPLAKMGINNVMQTHDGKTALEIVRWFCPDIIITDICMPRMDGMSFAAAVRKVQPACLLIFITGFAEIGYLKQAIELSAVAFVEKPLQPDELIHAVQNAISKHQERMNADQRSESLQKLRRQQAAAMMMHTRKDLQELRSLCAKIGFPTDAAYRCLALRAPQSNVHDVMDILAEAAAKNGFDCAADQREDRNVYAVLAAGKRKQPRELSALVDMLHKRLPGIVTAEGMVVPALEKVHESRKAASRMLEGSFYDGGRTHFLYEEKNTPAVLSVDAYAQFVRLLEENAAQLPAWLEDLLTRVEAVRSDRVESVKSLMLAILRELYRRTPELYGKVYGISQASELEDYVASVAGIGQFREMLAVLFEQLNAMEDANSRFSQVVRDAKSFIAQHIHEPELGLKEIAAQVNFSAAYLNVVFRTETGMTVKQYLIDCRLREAKRLLKDPSVRITEIAQRCGYSNSNYFAKAFKESTGMTPGEYRERKV